jgi:hypothetical protein
MVEVVFAGRRGCDLVGSSEERLTIRSIIDLGKVASQLASGYKLVKCVN